MIQNIHISGALDRAIFLRDGDYFLKKLDQPTISARHFDINTLLQFGGDIVVKEKIEETQLNQLIQDQSDLQSGLQLAIEGIAPRTPINDKFRQPTIELLEEYLADAPIYEFAHTRMMSKPATEDTDIAEALRIAQTHQYTKAIQFYTDLQAAQPALQAFWTLWKEVTYAYFDTEQALIEVEDQLLESGTFAKINQRLHTAKTKKEADEIVFLVPQNLIRLFQEIAQQYTDRQEIKEKLHNKISEISNEDGKREISIEVLIHSRELSKITHSFPNKTFYRMSGNSQSGNSVARKIKICCKEEAGQSIITIEDEDGTFSDTIIIEDSVTNRVIIEESDTDSIIIEESDTNNSITIKIPKGEINKAVNTVASSDILNSTA